MFDGKESQETVIALYAGLAADWPSLLQDKRLSAVALSALCMWGTADAADRFD